MYKNNKVVEGIYINQVSKIAITYKHKIYLNFINLFIQPRGKNHLISHLSFFLLRTIG